MVDDFGQSLTRSHTGDLDHAPPRPDYVDHCAAGVECGQSIAQAGTVITAQRRTEPNCMTNIALIGLGAGRGGQLGWHGGHGSHGCRGAGVQHRAAAPPFYGAFLCGSDSSVVSRCSVMARRNELSARYRTAAVSAVSSRRVTTV